MLQALNNAFEILAKKYINVKFLLIRSTDGDEDFDPIALPTVNIYLDKVIVACYTRVGLCISSEKLMSQVELLLEKTGIKVFGLPPE